MRANRCTLKYEDSGAIRVIVQCRSLMASSSDAGVGLLRIVGNAWTCAPPKRGIGAICLLTLMIRYRYERYLIPSVNVRAKVGRQVVRKWRAWKHGAKHRPAGLYHRMCGESSLNENICCISVRVYRTNNKHARLLQTQAERLLRSN